MPIAPPIDGLTETPEFASGVIPQPGDRPFTPPGRPGPGLPGLSRFSSAYRSLLERGAFSTPMMAVQLTLAGTGTVQWQGTAALTVSTTPQASGGFAAMTSSGLAPQPGDRPKPAPGRVGPGLPGLSRFHVALRGLDQTVVLSTTGTGGLTVSVGLSAMQPAIAPTGVVPSFTYFAVPPVGRPPIQPGITRFAWPWKELLDQLSSKVIAGPAVLAVGKPVLAATGLQKAIGTGALTVHPALLGAGHGISIGTTQLQLAPQVAGLGEVSLQQLAGTVNTAITIGMAGQGLLVLPPTLITGGGGQPGRHHGKPWVEQKQAQERLVKAKGVSPAKAKVGPVPQPVPDFGTVLGHWLQAQQPPVQAPKPLPPPEPKVEVRYVPVPVQPPEQRYATRLERLQARLKKIQERIARAKDG